MSLLPPRSTALERGLAAGAARISGIPTPLAELWNPATCPIDLLPWLAWALSADRWEAGWTEAEKRFAVANAIELQRLKGTPASIDALLASFDELLTLTEWFEATPPMPPHTFEIRLPLGSAGGRRSSAAFAAAIVRDVRRLKPVRSHFQLVQALAAAASLFVFAGAQVMRFDRFDAIAVTEIASGWALLLQDGNGEPLQDDRGGSLEHQPL